MEQRDWGLQENLFQYAGYLKINGFSREEVFKLVLAEFNGTPYIWGGCNCEGSDCSGTVCTSLNALFDKRIRVTADSLFRNYFTKPAEGYEGIQAAFFLNAEGKAVHVAGYMGDGLFLNESRLETNGGTGRTLKELKAMYPAFILVRRKLEENRWV